MLPWCSAGLLHERSVYSRAHLQIVLQHAVRGAKRHELKAVQDVMCEECRALSDGGSTAVKERAAARAMPVVAQKAPYARSVRTGSGSARLGDPASCGINSSVFRRSTKRHPHAACRHLGRSRRGGGWNPRGGNVVQPTLKRGASMAQKSHGRLFRCDFMAIRTARSVKSTPGAARPAPKAQRKSAINAGPIRSCPAQYPRASAASRGCWAPSWRIAPPRC